MKRWVWLAVAPLFTSCVPTPQSYAIPPQHAPVVQRSSVGDSVRAEDPKAPAYFIKDVKGLEGPDWRWTHAEPEFRFDALDGAPKVLRIEFSVHERTFRDTGPLGIEYYVNGHLLATEKYPSEGRKYFEKLVPPEWLLKGENRVLMKILNPWVAPDPGVRLGVLFHAAALVNP